jgi:hypothetical protein
MPTGRAVELKWEGDIAVFATARGATYVVDRPSDAFDTHAPPAIESKPAAGPRKYTGLGPIVFQGDIRQPQGALR